MTSPRTPRQWNAGDEEPADRPEVVDREGRTWRWSKHGGFAGAWIQYVGGTPLFWNTLAKFYGPLSEVLPETPEPPRDPRAEATRWAVGQALSRGEEIEIPGLGIFALDEEPPPGCCGGCDGSGRVPDPDTGGYCADCYGTGHLHTGPCTPASVPASQSVPAVPVSSTGGKETGEGDEDAQGATEVDWTEEPRFADFREAYDYATIHFSTAIRAHAKVDRREAHQIWHTIQLGMEKIQRERSPLADSETEWGVWMSPDSVHLVVETDDGELDGLEHDSDAGWLPVGMYDQVPDEFIRLVPEVQS